MWRGSNMSETRKFGGKEFRRGKRFFSKDTAKGQATLTRAKGYCVRVVKSKKSSEYKSGKWVRSNKYTYVLWVRRRK